MMPQSVDPHQRKRLAAQGRVPVSPDQLSRTAGSDTHSTVGSVPDAARLRWLEQTIELQAKALRERDETVGRLEERLARCGVSDGTDAPRDGDTDQWLVERVVDEQQRAAGLERQLRSALELLRDREEQLGECEKRAAAGEQLLEQAQGSLRRHQQERLSDSLASHSEWARRHLLSNPSKLPPEQAAAMATELHGRRREVLEVAKRMEGWHHALRMRCCRAGITANGNRQDSPSPPRNRSVGSNPLDGFAHTGVRELRREGRRLTAALMRRLRGEATVFTTNAVAHYGRRYGRVISDPAAFAESYRTLRRLVRQGVAAPPDGQPWMAGAADAEAVQRRLSTAERSQALDAAREMLLHYDSHPRAVRSAHAELTEELLANEHAVVAVLRVCITAADDDVCTGPTSLADLTDLPLSTPRRATSPPRRATSPPRRATSPPRRATSPPRRATSPPRTQRNGPGGSVLVRSQSAQHPPPRLRHRRPSPHPAAGRSTTQQHQPPQVPPPQQLQRGSLRTSRATPPPPPHAHEQPAAWQSTLRTRQPSPTAAARRRSAGTGGAAPPPPAFRRSTEDPSASWSQDGRHSPQGRSPHPCSAPVPRRPRASDANGEARPPRGPAPPPRPPPPSTPTPTPTVSVGGAATTTPQPPPPPQGVNWAQAAQRSGGLAAAVAAASPTDDHTAARSAAQQAKPSTPGRQERSAITFWSSSPSSRELSGAADLLGHDERMVIRDHALGAVAASSDEQPASDPAARSRMAEELRAWSSSLGTKLTPGKAKNPPPPPAPSAVEAWADEEDDGTTQQQQLEQQQLELHHQQQLELQVQLQRPPPAHVSDETPEERELRKLREAEEDRQQDLCSPKSSQARDDFDYPIDFSHPDYEDHARSAAGASCLARSSQRREPARVSFPEPGQ